jgi:UDP-GlcNAc3NAcA epimerase
MTVVGARPQFVKAAVVSRAIRHRAGVCEVLVHTGQHFDADMAQRFFDELGVPEPVHHLGVHGGSHADMTGRMLVALDEIARNDRPDAVVVYGDTNSTLAAALWAAKLAIPVAHVEAGLRSFRRAMPEEINRVVVDHVSDLLFCPTATAQENLFAEGIRAGVHLVGDVMYDAALDAMARAKNLRVRESLGVEGIPYALATVHRAENTDNRDALASIVEYLDDRAVEMPVVLPMHPRTKMALDRHGLSFQRVAVCPPVGHLEMASLLLGAHLVLTDSGGLQKEAYFFRVPCVTLRDETEWVETVDAGWNRLWRSPDVDRERSEIDDYGDGRAGERIVDILVNDLAARSPDTTK